MPRFGEKQRLEKFGRAVASLRASGSRLTPHTISAHSGINHETCSRLMAEQWIISESATRKGRKRPKRAVEPEPRSKSLIVREARRIKRVLEKIPPELT